MAKECLPDNWVELEGAAEMLGQCSKDEIKRQEVLNMTFMV